MDNLFGVMTGHWWIVIVVVLVLFFLLTFKNTIKLFGVYLIPSNAIGIVEKRFSFGRPLPDGKLVALNGEAGLQADTLAPGLKLWLWPWQYKVKIVPFVTIRQGYIGLVESKDGKPLPAGRVLAKAVDCENFQDARMFLGNGGERGTQIAIIPEGVYRINTELFTVTQVPVTVIPDNKVGIVITKEGEPLENDDIAGPKIEGHNMYQNAQAFIDNHGKKGLQEQVMLAGRYYINPMFAEIQLEDMTVVPIASVGVVVSYVGKPGKDTSGQEFEHGNIVSEGEKGVWEKPLDPGKHPINPHTQKVEIVSTANIVLNWANDRNEAHELDKDLCSITVRSADGFKFNLDVSQIIHVPSTAAPKVIARFGNMKNLVTQVLEPIIGNYFRNSAQKSDVISFLAERHERQNDAKAQIEAALKQYDVKGVDTLIGDINPPDELMVTLTDRKIAEQEKLTYRTQREAEQTRTELMQAKAQADTQASVVTAQRGVEIADFNAQSTVKAAEGEAKSKTINAEADANVLKVIGEAQAENNLAVGQSDAEVIRLKTEAQGQDKYALVEGLRALGSSGQRLVPEIVVVGGGSENGEGGSTLLMNTLLAQVMKDKLVPATTETPATNTRKSTSKKADDPTSETQES